MAQRARAIVTTCGCTADRLKEEFRALARLVRRSMGASRLAAGVTGDAALHRHRAREGAHFVIVGTLEPRKNHVLLLSVWRELVARAAKRPSSFASAERGGAPRKSLTAWTLRILAPMFAA